MPVLLLVRPVTHCLRTSSLVAFGLLRLAFLAVRSHNSLAAENLFLRKQLALFQERKVKPRRADDATRWLMATLGRMFQWRNALVNVKPDTLIRWQRKGFRLFWRWKSKPPGRPRLPKDLRELIRQMAADNISWGEERIANELKLKLGIRVSPRTVALCSAINRLAVRINELPTKCITLLRRDSADVTSAPPQPVTST
jgi:putative transposase